MHESTADEHRPDLGPRDIDLVVTDLDGTLWDVDERIHDKTLAALHALEELGVPLLVATGRRLRSAVATLARSDLAPPVVALDGAVGRDVAAGRTFHRERFGPGDGMAVLAAFRAHGLEPYVYVDRPDVDVVVSREPPPGQLLHVRPHLAVDDLDRVVAAEPVLTFGLAGTDPAALAAVVVAAAPHADGSVMPDLMHGGSACMLRPKGVSKWAGVLAWCADQGLDPDRVLAVGDGENDVELLTGAAVACVVQDGCDAALALADHVIDPAAAGGWSSILEHC